MKHTRTTELLWKFHRNHADTTHFTTPDEGYTTFIVVTKTTARKYSRRTE